MTEIALDTRPPLAGCAPPPEKSLGFFAQIRASNENAFETFPRIAYEIPVWQPKSMLNPMVVISDPEGVRRVLVDNVANYPKHEMERRFFRAMFGGGLLAIDGDLWRAHRKVMAPPFHPRSVMAYGPPMAACAEACAERWRGLADGRHVDVADEMRDVTLRIICRTMFSTDADELVGATGKALGFAQDALTFNFLDLLPVIGPWRLRGKQKAIKRDFSVMDAAIYRMIDARKRDLANAPDDLLTRLIAAEDPETGVGLSREEIRDEVITIFMAGHETTASTLTWAWYALSQRPEAESKLHAELDAVLGGRTASADDLTSLPYTRMVIDEAMRLYPAAPGISARVAVKDDVVSGVRIKAGQSLMICPWILHRHEELWERPLEFDPDRFSPERSHGRPRFAHMPFSGGPKVCIGASLAITEAVIILATLAQKFQARLAPAEEVKLRTRITLFPKDGLKMVLEPRSAA
ncbi:MAG TPA: cytochrome P450 [Caulobacteraceae bacterium]